METKKRNNPAKKANMFSLSVNFYLSVDGKFDYTKDYMSNIARIITRKHPSYHVHKRSEEIIKAYIRTQVTRKVENLCDSQIENLEITHIRELSEIVAEYDGTEKETNNPTPSNNPSFSEKGMELFMAVDSSSKEIQSLALDKPQQDVGNGVAPTIKPRILKKAVIRVSVSFDVYMETKLYLYFLQELPDFFSFNELDCLRVRVNWQQVATRLMQEPEDKAIKVVRHSRFIPWIIAVFTLITFCLIGITTLFFVVPDLYKQDIYLMRGDTLHQSISIQESRVEWENVTFPKMPRDTIIVIDKKKVVIK